MEYKEFIHRIEAIAPPELAEPWDNSGIQIYSGKENVQKILVCLDVTEPTLKEAIGIGADMIVSHHPLIFDSMKSIDADSVLGNKIHELIQAGISVYSAHMTYDKGSFGNTVMMGKRLGIKGRPIHGMTPDARMDCSVLMAEPDAPIATDALCRLISDRLAIPNEELRLVMGNKGFASKIALCAGSGGDYWKDLVALGCDTYITGDVKYHMALDAKEAGMTLIDPGHFGTEKHFAQDFAKTLSGLVDDNLEIHISSNDVNPFGSGKGLINHL